MISLNREQRGHFNRLRAASHLEADLAFLKELDPKNELITKPSGKGERYTNDILSVLLSLTTHCDIVVFRRTYVRNELLKAQSGILASRFTEYLKVNATGFPIAKNEDIVSLVNSISEGLIIKVIAEIDTLIGANAEDIELKAIDNEHFSICLTEAAIKSRKEAAVKIQAEADRIAQEKADNAAKAQAEADRIAKDKAELEAREQELKGKEDALADKEDELADKESELEEKEDELADKESELEEKVIAEKKSVSKKKNTRK